MALEIVNIQRGDNLGTVLYALRQVRETHALLVLPGGRALLGEYADMVQVRQLAHSLGIRVGVVAADPQIRAVARAAAVPVYFSQSIGGWRLTQARPWWYPLPARYPGKPTIISDHDKKAVNYRIRPWPRWLHFIWQYMASIITVFTIAVLIVTGYFVFPGATVVLKPTLEQLSIVEPIIVDPRYDEDAAEPNSVPGRLLVSVIKWRASAAPTDFKEVPTTPARGQVTFINKVPQDIVIPAGTRVSTSTGQRIIFQTIEDALAPGRIGGEIAVPVVAIEPGTQGNVIPNRINRVEGQLATVLNVRNLYAMSGGNVRYAKTTNEKDRERLRQHVLNGIRDQATADMLNQLEADEFLVDDSIRLVFIYDEEYSSFNGEETDALTLEVRAELHGTAVNEQIALDMVYAQLDAVEPPGFTILAETIRPQLGDLLGVDNTGRVTLELVGEATAAADLALNDPMGTIAGQEVAYALGYLDENLPLRALPDVRIWPRRFERLPYVPARIQVLIDTDATDEAGATDGIEQ